MNTHLKMFIHIDTHPRKLLEHYLTSTLTGERSVMVIIVANRLDDKNSIPGRD